MVTLRRRAFTLMEMLIIMTIIGILLGLLLPVVSHARRVARAAECQNHLAAYFQATSLWLKDHRDVYPGVADGDPYHYTDAGGTDQTAYVTPYNLLGKAGAGDEGDKTPIEGRLLNRYASDSSISECPLDWGTRQQPDGDLDSFDKDAQFRSYDYHGSSYFYAARTPKEIKTNQWVLRHGMWLIGGHRHSQIENPRRKLIFADANILPEFAGDNALHQWHNNAEPLVANVAYADGHVQDVHRKTKERFDWSDKEFDFAEYHDTTGEAQKAIRGLLDPRVPAGVDPHNPGDKVLEDSPYY